MLSTKKQCQMHQHVKSKQFPKLDPISNWAGYQCKTRRVKATEFWWACKLHYKQITGLKWPSSDGNE